MLSGSQTPDFSLVEVSLGDRSYRIEIGTKSIETFCQSILSALDDLSHAMVIADEAVESHWAMPIASSIAKAKTESGDEVRVNLMSVPSGETSKSIEQVDKLWQWMLESSCDRRSAVIAIGGGVIGDLAGFAAATFTRGIRFVQVPTTLLAMVDSSVGGKTGINLPTAKNMVGAFWQPSLVCIDTAILSTLSDRDFRSGLGEVVKYGVIDDVEFFMWLEENASALADRDDDAVRYAVAKSCESKASVVGEDERETSGRRAILNYGHTFAHAIEATAGYGNILHGEAVAIGMQMAANLAIELKLCEPDLLDRQTKLLKACGLPTTFAAADPEAMLPVMRRDKKVSHGNLRFVLPERIGSVMLLGDIQESGVVNAIQACTT